MSWDSWNEFAAMGGYGPYVWGSFGMVFLLMALEVAALDWRWRAVRERIAQRAGAEPRA